MSTGHLSIAEATALAAAALQAAGTSPENARIVAEALVAAEADGLGSHGLSRVPAYADQAGSGKVQGAAVPMLETPTPAVVRVDAKDGFAFPAIAKGLDAAAERVRETGVVAVAVRNSHHAGALGWHVERMAERGLVAIAFTNSPAGIAPWGGAKAVFGTNPIAFATPRQGRPPLVVDASLSNVARGKIMLAAQKGELIPEGWALDAEGRTTTDPKAGLAGTMVPMGDAKGAALVLMVEVLAAALTGGQFGFEASSFFTAEGPPPRIGQLFLVLDPVHLAGPDFSTRLEVLLGAILEQPGTRLPGDRRLGLRKRAQAEGLRVDEKLLAELQRRAGRTAAAG
jgi:(2R)-3-sulfolactate dehydrogenase (NADP+)